MDSCTHKTNGLFASISGTLLRTCLACFRSACTTALEQDERKHCQQHGMDPDQQAAHSDTGQRCARIQILESFGLPFSQDPYGYGRRRNVSSFETPASVQNSLLAQARVHCIDQTRAVRLHDVDSLLNEATQRQQRQKSSSEEEL